MTNPMQRTATVPITQIYIGERLRKDYGDLTDIQQTAKTYMGQIQSLAVCHRDNVEQPYELLAGGRRLQAFTEMGKAEVHVIIYPKELTIFQRKTIEFQENLARLDLSWYEQVSATKAIHDLQVSEHGKKAFGITSGGWSQPQTAKLLGRSVSAINRDLAIAQAIEIVPELTGCKTKHDAENLIARIEEDQAIKELARRVQVKTPTTGIDKQRQELTDSFMLADFFEGVKEIPDESVDLVELDPPYGIDFEKIGSTKAKESDIIEKNISAAFHSWSKQELNYESFLSRILVECHRVLKPNSWLIMWYAQHPWADEVYHQIHNQNFQCQRVPGIWVKWFDPDQSKAVQARTACPDRYLSRMHECFYYARKGNPIVRRRGRLDVFCYKGVLDKDRTHPTEKPIPLMQDILQTFAMPGSKILVPFLGSGNTLIAAANSSMQATGFELSSEFKDKFVLKTQNWIPLKDEEQT